MNHLTGFLIIAVTVLGVLHACGPDEEELRQQELAEEQARQDSLERAEEAELRQMQQDEMEQQSSEERMEEDEEDSWQIDYNPDGSFTVQVQSWRSRVKAEERADMWKGHGFDHAYVVEYGDDETGDVWFRVRLGNVSSFDMATRLQEKLKAEHNTDSWIDTAN